MRSRLLAASLALLAGTTAVAAPAAAAPGTKLADDPVLTIAHRGASGLAPEHTLAAYDLALATSDYLEQDAQITRDGVLVSLHDATLDRTARGPAENCTGPVGTKTLAQLRTCEVGSWFNERYPERARPEYAGQRIPTMSEVFARYGADVNYHVELKDGDPRTARELLRLLDVHGLRSAAHTSWRVLVQSFVPTDLQLVRALDPAMPTVQLLPGTPPAGPARDALLDAVATYADGIGPSAGGVDAGLVTAAHERCLDVHPYTVDDPDGLRRLVDAGVDGIFTNRPDVLEDVLERKRRRDGDDLARAAAAAEGDRRCRA